MKTFINIGLFCLLATGVCMAQNTTTITQTNKNGDMTTTHTTTSSSSSVTISVTEDDGTKTAVSINDSDGVYHFTASFSDQMHGTIVEYLDQKLGKEFQQESNKKGSKKEWKKSNDNDVLWSVRLKERSLKMFLDKESSTEKAYNKLKQIGDELGTMLGEVN